jgi:hypothetical protein
MVSVKTRFCSVVQSGALTRSYYCENVYLELGVEYVVASAPSMRHCTVIIMTDSNEQSWRLATGTAEQYQVHNARRKTHLKCMKHTGEP